MQKKSIFSLLFAASCRIILHFGFLSTLICPWLYNECFFKRTNQGCPIGSKQDRPKNSKSCHRVRRVSYQISKHLCKPTLPTAGRQIVDISQSEGHDGLLPRFTAFPTQPGFLRAVQTSRLSCHGTALSSLPRPCARCNMTRTCWIGTSTGSSWPPITSAATCCGRKPGIARR